MSAAVSATVKREPRQMTARFHPQYPHQKMNRTIELLHDAKHEINSLRRRNEILSAKVEVMDLLACFLHTQPATREQGMTIDVAYELERHANELAEREKATAVAAQARPVSIRPGAGDQF